MTETEFNYRRAWRELAEPAFEALPGRVRDLYETVCVRCDGLGQGRNLDMSWPDGDDVQPADTMRAAFEAIDSEHLALASRAVYFYGHWSPSGHSYKGGGGTWKFASYADQVLRERLGIDFPMTYESNAPKQYRVCQGALRVCFQGKDFWTWEEAGPATDPVMTKTRTLVDRCASVVTYESAEKAKAEIRTRNRLFVGWEFIGASETYADPKGTMAAEEQTEREAKALEALGAENVAALKAIRESERLAAERLFDYRHKAGGIIRDAARGKDCTEAMYELRGDFAVLSRHLRDLADSLPEPKPLEAKTP